MALLGRRVPFSLKILLTVIAVFDVLGAIIIIALFYTSEMSLTMLAAAAAAYAVLVASNLFRVTKVAPYVLIGITTWVCVLKSRVHVTLAGVAIALTIPLRAADVHGHSPLRHLEHGLHRRVTFGVLPIFAFANAGVTFEGIWLAQFCGAGEAWHFRRLVRGQAD